MKFKYLALVVAAAAATTAYAEEAAPAKKKKPTWQANAELGAIITTGNTETTSFKGGLNVKHNLEKWNNEYKLDGFFKEDEVEQDDGSKETERTNERYSASAQGNYKLKDENSHLFIYGGYVSDYFGAYREEAVISGGYGFQVLDNPSHELSLEFGPGYKYFKYPDDSTEVDDNGELLAGEWEGEIIAVAKADYAWQISEGAQFTQLVAIEYGSTNTKTVSETALLTKINGSLQMKVGFNVIHNSDVADDKENTDTETALTLVYNF